MAHGAVKFTVLAAAVGAALYAGIGYIGVPYATRAVLDSAVAQKLGRPVALEDVSFNPWTWTYELKGLSIPDRKGGSLAKLALLRIDASAETLSKMAPVLDEVTIDGLVVNADMDAGLREDIAALTGSGSSAEGSAGAKSGSEDASAGGDALPDFALYNISVKNSSLRFADKAAGIDQSVTDISLELPFVSTLATSRSSLVTPALSFKVNDTPIEATGSTKPFGSSLEAQLNLKVSNLALAPFAKMVPALAGPSLSLADGALSTDLTFVFQNPTGGSPAKMLLSGSASVENASLVQGAGKAAAELAGFKRASIVLKEVDLVENSAVVQSASIEGPRAHLENSAKGLNVLQAVSAVAGGEAPAVSAAPSASSASGDSAAASGWTWLVASASLKDGAVTWKDTTVSPAANIAVKNIALSAAGIGSSTEKPGTWSGSASLLGGQIAAKGSLSLAPLAVSADLTGDKLALKQAASYVKSATGLDVDATAAFRVKAGYSAQDVTAAGDVAVTGIAVKQGKSTLATVRSASASLESFSLAKNDVKVKSAVVDGAVVNAVNTKSGLNFANLGGASAAAAEKSGGKSAEKASEKAASAASGPAWTWAVATASVKNSTLNFRDETIKPVGTAQITKLNATVKNLSSAKGAKPVLDVSAGLGGGTLNAAGSFGLEPLSASIDVEAAKIGLKSFSALMQGYAGLGAKSGDFSARGKLTLASGKDGKAVPAWKGDMSLASLDLVNAKGSGLMSWSKASLAGMDVAATDPIRLVVAHAEIDQPAEKQTQTVKKVAGLASLISSLAGKSDRAEKIDKYAGKLDGSIVLENVRYENGKFSANGVSAASLGGVLLGKLSDAMSEKLGK